MFGRRKRKRDRAAEAADGGCCLLEAVGTVTLIIGAGLIPLLMR